MKWYLVSCFEVRSAEEREQQLEEKRWSRGERERERELHSIEPQLSLLRTSVKNGRFPTYSRTLFTFSLNWTPDVAELLGSTWATAQHTLRKSLSQVNHTVCRNTSVAHLHEAVSKPTTDQQQRWFSDSQHWSTSIYLTAKSKQFDWDARSQFLTPFVPVRYGCTAIPGLLSNLLWTFQSRCYRPRIVWTSQRRGHSNLSVFNRTATSICLSDFRSL